jgi:hypothetical protein
MNKFIIVFSAVLLPAIFMARAQKLPSTQAAPLRAPSTVKTDGKSTEWLDKFQAYNTNIEAFYTIANDDENLYLIVKATTHDIADKIIRGGVTLIVNHTVKKNDPEAVSVTYPILRNADMSAVSNMLARRSYKQDDEMLVSQKQLNDVLEAKAKTIEVAGVKAITDKEISVYNEDGIKAASQFDDKNAFVYELAVPLKYLNLPNNGAEGFTYHIKINEMPTTHVAGGGPPPPPVMIGTMSTTDFWGVYKLDKQ